MMSTYFWMLCEGIYLRHGISPSAFQVCLTDLFVKDDTREQLHRPGALCQHVEDPWLAGPAPRHSALHLLQDQLREREVLDGLWVRSE